MIHIAKLKETIMQAAAQKHIPRTQVLYDSVVEEAIKRNILVTNTPDVLTEATADLAFALILGTSRRIGEAERLIRKGEWKSWGPTLLLGQDVYGSSLGIVGLGRIGKAVARRARGFNMTIFHTGRTQEDDPETGSRWLPLEELLASSDIVTLHCPLDENTRHIINREALNLMKSSAILVNTGRGGLIDQDALYEALAEKRIAAAGLDVFDPEPLPAGHRLLSLENILPLPHIGSASIAAREGMAVLAAKNLLAVLEGKEPLCRVTL